MHATWDYMPNLKKKTCFVNKINLLYLISIDLTIFFVPICMIKWNFDNWL